MLKIFAQSLKSWLADDPFTQSAAAAYYAIFSLPGLLIIVMGLAAIFFDQARVEQEVLGHLRNMMGADTAQSINEIVNETQRNNRDIWAMVVGIATLVFGATGLFAQLQKSLNKIWDVEVRASAGWVAFLKTRLVSFGLILIVGFLLLVSLSLTSLVTIFSGWVAQQFSPDLAVALSFVDVVFSFLFVAALFTMIFKILPDANVPWKAAVMGAIVATLFFTIGEYALNSYFSFANPASSFGAAGSIILLMLWVSYSCMILFIGAEFAKAYMHARMSERIKPSEIGKVVS